MVFFRLALALSVATIASASYNETEKLFLSALRQQFNSSLVGKNAAVTLTECGTGTGISNVKFSFSPNPAIVGEPVTITGSVDYAATDKNPNYNIQASFGAIKLIPAKEQDGSLCEENTIPLVMNVGKVIIGKVAPGCPVAVGTSKLTVTLPVAPLKGTVVGKFNIKKSDGSPAVCLDLTIKVD